MKRNMMHQLIRMLALTGTTWIWLTSSAMGELTTSANRDHLKVFTPMADSRLLLLTMQSEAGIAFEKFVRFQALGESFVYASTAPEGSGAFITEDIFWIAPDRTIHPIVFEHAGKAYENKAIPGEFVLTGGPGVLFSKGRLFFEFLIADKGDSRCCPTAGRISGTYKMVGEKAFDAASKKYSCTYKLVVDRCRRYVKSTASDQAERSR